MRGKLGHYLRLSPPRRMVNDFLYAGRQQTLTVIERRMELGAVVAARAAASPRPSWCALFTKALAAVSARRPELRRAYVPLPWPRLFEYHENCAGVVIERDLAGESALFLARLRAPETLSIADLDARIRQFKTKPIAQLSGFRGALRLASLPVLARRLFWWLTMNALPALRGQLLGTFGVSVTAGKGAAGLYLVAPWTITLHYDVFDAAGALEVRFTFDHRAIDGAALAAALADLEAELRGPLCAELHALRQAAA